MKELWMFPKDQKAAIAAQKEMAKSLLLEHNFSSLPEIIGGVDVSNTPFDSQKMIFGAIALIKTVDVSLIETASKAIQETFPYRTGLLGFRESPVIARLYQELSKKPDLLMVDGHGICHPRRLGIASHLGILLNIPTIGVAKSLLVGKLQYPLGEEVGSVSPIIYQDEEIGMALRTKKRCNPLIVSAGHKMTLAYAMEVVHHCLRGYKLPEPTRMAHLIAGRCRKGFFTTNF